MNVVVDGLMANYQKIGSGKQVLLMLHGWGDTAQTFTPLIEQLQADFVIYALDLPGFGGSQAPPNAWGLADYADFVQKWQQKLAIGSLLAVIGHSYGGSIAVAAVGSGRLKPKKIVLLASSGIRGTAKARKSLLKLAAKAVKLPLKLLPVSKQRQIKRKAYSAIGSDISLLPHMELTYKRIIGEDIRPLAAKIHIPTLLIYGRQDKDTPVKYGELLHRAIKNSQLKITDGGHFLHQEQAAETANLISDFLEAGGV